MLYKSTRGEDFVESSQAILSGIAPDGGLYIPCQFPILDLKMCDSFTYQELAAHILSLYLSDFTEAEIKCAVYKAYDDKFVDEIVPIQFLQGRSILELFHGRTLAFKDMALSILPYLMKTAAKKQAIKEDLVVLTATSGDTGKAALEGFSGIPGIKVVVFYPSEGISDIQKHQMVSQEGDNTFVFGIKGNFDDAQTSVKSIFLDEKLKKTILGKGYLFSSANSINIGRLIPQIVYYVHGYLNHVKQGKIKRGDEMNLVVPTGNFGNILAAKYAKEMGLPIHKLVCASNENDVLTDFIQTGTYDLNRPFRVTNSPSMDIMISSNLERYLAYLGEDVGELMKLLETNKKYSISEEARLLMNDFHGGRASQSQTLNKIKEVFIKEGYLMDTHTAVAQVVYDDYQEATGDHRLAMIAATASPFKFTRAVLSSISDDLILDDDFELIDVLSKKAGIPVPEPIKGLVDQRVRHPHVINKVAIKNTVEAILR